jgi:hypothetical protein
MKKCMNCGKELPDEAAFCPYCTTNQGEKQQVAPRWFRRQLWLPVSLCVLALLAVVGILLWRSGSDVPEVLESSQMESAPSAECYYTDDDGTYQVFLCFELEAVSEPQGSREITLPEGASGSTNSILVVYKDQSRGREEFADKIVSCSVEAIPEEGYEAMTLSEPRMDYDFPAASLLCDVEYSAACGTNQLVWTLEMENGETLTLCQTLTASLAKTMDIYAEDYPMETLEELQYLIDQLDRIAGQDTIVTIFLPPNTYEGDLKLSGHAAALVGATDDNGEPVTTIQGSIQVSTQRPDLVRLTDIHVVGSGSGTGLSASAGVALDGCTFSGWDIGSVANHGAFVSAHNTTFEENGVGLKFKTASYGHCDSAFTYNVFRNNGIAVQIEELGGDVELMFDGTVFSGNEQDLDNPDGQAVNLDAAIFE